MKEGGSRQHHGELTGVVGVVEPGLVVDVPGVVPPREAHDAIPGLAPHPGTQRNATSTRAVEPGPPPPSLRSSNQPFRTPHSAQKHRGLHCFLFVLFSFFFFLNSPGNKTPYWTFLSVR